MRFVSLDNTSIDWISDRAQVSFPSIAFYRHYTHTLSFVYGMCDKWLEGVLDKLFARSDVTLRMITTHDHFIRSAPVSLRRIPEALHTRLRFPRAYSAPIPPEEKVDNGNIVYKSVGGQWYKDHHQMFKDLIKQGKYIAVDSCSPLL